MSLPFFYIAEFNPQDNLIVLNEETSKHVVQVLRMKVGGSLQLTDGCGHLITATIQDDHKKKCVVQPIQTVHVPRPSYTRAIAISLIKNTSRFEWFLEKATEIGVTAIYPLMCARTEKQHVRMDRMKSILISAMLQSKQSWLPELHMPTSFNAFCAAHSSQAKYIAHCIDDTAKEEPIAVHQQQNAAILIGPEGDFTPEEIQHALVHEFVPLSLGTHRLRTETAGVVAATLLSIY